MIAVTAEVAAKLAALEVGKLGPRQETSEEFEARFKEATDKIISTVRQQMPVRAKFKVDSHSITVVNGVECRSVKLSPVYSSDPESENAKFFKWTPSGSIDLGTINKAAWEKLELGKEYYVDFIPAQ